MMVIGVASFVIGVAVSSKFFIAAGIILGLIALSNKKSDSVSGTKENVKGDVKTAVSEQKCLNCGVKVASDDNYCPDCGKKIEP